MLKLRHSIAPVPGLLYLLRLADPLELGHPGRPLARLAAAPQQLLQDLGRHRHPLRRHLTDLLPLAPPQG